MKYSPSTRFINIIINVLLLVGFGFLGIWFAFFVTPNLLTSSQPMPGVKLPEMGVGLSALLASLGIAGTIVALCGTIFSFGAFFKGNNDDLVRKTFSCYIALGYVISTFFFLNAILFYRLTSTNFDESLDLAFVIAVYAVLTILAMIATNVPLLHMYGEGEHTNQIMKTVTGGVLAIDLAVALVFGTLYLANLGNRGSFANSNAVLSKAGIFALLPLVAALVGVATMVGYSMAEKKNAVRKSNAYLFAGLLGANGLSLIGATLVEHLEVENKMLNISFMAKAYGARFNESMEFFTMGYITGGLVLLVAILVAYYTVFPPKKAIEE